MKKNVVLGVTSGIAAYKTLDLVSELKKNCDVFVVMTKAAAQMVDPKEFAKASGNKVFTELFEETFDYKHILKARKVDHIDLADKADVICVAPATANSIAKIAHGIADDFLTTMILASNSPLILSPSMNVHMWTNPVTKENIEKLKSRGVIILPPENGPLACGYDGPGRLPHILTIKEEIMRQVSYSRSLSGKKVVVTAGPTKENIDDVRFVTNNSSGKMGIALSDECHLRGAEVILLKAKNAVSPRYRYNTEEFETYDELETLLKKYVKEADLIFHTAAVGDFSVEGKMKGKISSNKPLSLDLTSRKKLSDQIKKANPKVKVIIFKAEWGLSEEELIKKAKDKLKASTADVVVANDLSKKGQGFQSDDNEVVVVTKKGSKTISLRSKRAIAKRLVEMMSLKQNK